MAKQTKTMTTENRKKNIELGTSDHKFFIKSVVFDQKLCISYFSFFISEIKHEMQSLRYKNALWKLFQSFKR